MPDKYTYKYNDEKKRGTTEAAHKYAKIHGKSIRLSRVFMQLNQTSQKLPKRFNKSNKETSTATKNDNVEPRQLDDIEFIAVASGTRNKQQLK